ncbi:hypothetical protein BDA96_06G105300 [Sorghum bicolor]|uniref:Uncharacterized protein n=1 Tax=Sorghum bicolor TaxID=4558 RepID=A0A921QST1_SORBI|nr:hypothetical protein BDA96_06G105300 [Sorghum bicolor]
MHEYMAESIQDRRRTTTRMAKLLGGSHHSKWSTQYYGVYSFCCCDLLLDSTGSRPPMHALICFTFLVQKRKVDGGIIIILLLSNYINLDAHAWHGMLLVLYIFLGLC